MSMKIAVQVYSVRDNANENLKETLKKIKEFGYDGVEFAGLCGHTPSEVKAMCDELDLVPISAHVSYQEMMQDKRGVLSAYASIGCKYVAIPYLTEDLRPGTEGFSEVIKNAKELGKIAKELGMTLLYHNHDFEFQKIDGEYALDILYKEVPKECIETELDTCWVKVGGEDPAKYIEKYSGRTPLVHLKDYVGGKTDNMYELIGIESEKKEPEEKAFEFRPVGYGCQNFKKILDASEKSGASWVVVEQDQPSMGLTPMECIKKSVEYLKTIIK